MRDAVKRRADRTILGGACSGARRAVVRKCELCRLRGPTDCIWGHPGRHFHSAERSCRAEARNASTWIHTFALAKYEPPLMKWILPDPSSRHFHDIKQRSC